MNYTVSPNQGTKSLQTAPVAKLSGKLTETADTVDEDGIETESIHSETMDKKVGSSDIGLYLKGRVQFASPRSTDLITNRQTMSRIEP